MEGTARTEAGMPVEDGGPGKPSRFNDLISRTKGKGLIKPGPQGSWVAGPAGRTDPWPGQGARGEWASGSSAARGQRPHSWTGSLQSQPIQAPPS